MHDTIPRVALVRRPETRQAMIDRAMSPGPAPAGPLPHCFPDMETVARVFCADNLDLLTRLRALGHVSLDEAAATLGYQDAKAFVLRTLDGLNLFLSFLPLRDGTAGVLVAFTSITIDLDVNDPTQPVGVRAAGAPTALR